MVDRNQQLQAYRGWLYRVAMSMVPAAEVDDLVQEGYIAMWRALGTYDHTKGAMPTWLTKAAKLRMADIARGHGRPTGHVGIVASPGSRRDSRDSRPAATGTAHLDGMAPGAMEEVEARVALWLDAGIDLAYHRGQIAQALAGLTEEQRTYIVLRFWHQMTATEIQPLIQSNVTHLWRATKNELQQSLQHLAA